VRERDPEGGRRRRDPVSPAAVLDRSDPAWIARIQLKSYDFAAPTGVLRSGLFGGWPPRRARKTVVVCARLELFASRRRSSSSFWAVMTAVPRNRGAAMEPLAEGSEAFMTVEPKRVVLLEE